MSTPALPNGVSGVMYGYQAHQWDDPLSFGVQALIDYNGLTINDRYQADRIRVFNITGLDDPDIRDSREPAPADDGEFVYDSFYGGRTFVMTGEIEAGSLNSVTRLQRDFKAAFATLVESPMKFRWFDVYDSFDNPQTVSAGVPTANYTALVGSLANVLASGGVLRVATASTNLFIRTSEQRTYGDSQQTIRVVVGSLSATSVFLVPKAKDATDYISCAYNEVSGTPTLTISTVVGGTTHQLASTSVPSSVQPQIGQSIWIRSRIEGDLLTCELWLTPPTTTTLPVLSLTAWLTGSDADLLGDSVLSQVGFGIVAADTTWALDDFKIESLDPGDIAFNARKLSPISIKDSQDNLTKFKRAFQLTMRASNFRALGATQARSTTLVPSTATPVALGRTYNRTYNRIYRHYIATSASMASNLLFVKNRGTARMRGILRLYGASGPFSLINLTNGQQMSWTGTIPDGDYLQFDCQAKTLVNSTGANQMEFMVIPTLQWMQFEPGWNDILIVGNGYSSNTKLIAWLQSAWM